MNKYEFYRMLRDNPKAAHECIIRSGDWDGLFNWMRNMSIKYRLTFVLRPERSADVQRWKIVAKLYLREIIDNSDLPPEFKEWAPVDSESLHEMCTHVCVPHYMKIKKSGKKVLRAGSLKRADKLPAYSRKVMTGAMGQYNAYVKDFVKRSGGIYMSMGQWLEAHPEILREWRLTLAKRKEGRHETR